MLLQSFQESILSFAGFGLYSTPYSQRTSVIWLCNLDQMRLIYSFYAKTSEIKRQGRCSCEFCRVYYKSLIV